MIFLLWPRLNSVLCSFHAALTRARPSLSPPTGFVFQFIWIVAHKGLVYFYVSFIFLQKRQNKTFRVTQPPTEFMSVSMAVKTQPLGLPHAMDAELEGLWPCMISISGQWFIISAANPFQPAFCLCELQKMGKRTIRDGGKQGGRLGSEGDQRRSSFKRFGTIRVWKKNKKQPHRLSEK